MMFLGLNLEFPRTGAERHHLWRIARGRLYSRRVAVRLSRDLTVPWPEPPAKTPLEVRQLQPSDDLSLVADVGGLDPRRAQERADQRWLLSSDLPNPWVAVDQEGTVCLTAWLLTERDNAAIRSTFGPLVPELKPEEVSIEGAFTAESHRGMGILPYVAHQLTEYAKDCYGAKRALTFIAEGNTASLRAAEKAGWSPVARREERWVLLNRRIRLLALDGSDLDV